MTYAKLPDALVDAWPGLSLSAKAVAGAIASHMNGTRGDCFPSVAALMKQSGLRRAKSVRKAIKELAEAGLLDVEHRGWHRSNSYRWTDRAGSAPPEAQDRAEDDRPKGVRPGAKRPSDRAQKRPLTLPLNKSTSTPSAPPQELTGLTLYESDAKLLKAWPELLPSWERAYPGVNVAAEVAKAHAWEVANPAKRKKDRARFLAGWLSRAKENNKGAGSTGGAWNMRG